MFDHFVWSVVVTPIAVVMAAGLVARRLAPGMAVAVVTWSAVVAAAASAVNLAAFGVKAFAELPAVARRFDWSDHVVRQDTAHVPWVSWLSLVWVVVAATAVVRAWRAHRRAVVRAAGYAAWLGGPDVVVVDDAVADAFAIPGRPGHIVVTSGMRDALNESQFQALLAHERAHLSGRHHRSVLLVRLCAVSHPAFWWVVREMDFLVERAADEHAAAAVGSRRTVAQAIGVAALAASGRSRGGSALGLIPTRARPSRAGVVPRRVTSLLAMPRPRSRILMMVPALLAAGTAVWTGECVYDLQELLRLAGASDAVRGRRESAAW